MKVKFIEKEFEKQSKLWKEHNISPHYTYNFTVKMPAGYMEELRELASHYGWSVKNKRLTIDEKIISELITRVICNSPMERKYIDISIPPRTYNTKPK